MGGEDVPGDPRPGQGLGGRVEGAGDVPRPQGLVPQKAQGKGLALSIHLLAPGVGAPPMPPRPGLVVTEDGALGEGTKFNFTRKKSRVPHTPSGSGRAGLGRWRCGWAEPPPRQPPWPRLERGPLGNPHNSHAAGGLPTRASIPGRRRRQR